MLRQSGMRRLLTLDPLSVEYGDGVNYLNLHGVQKLHEVLHASYDGLVWPVETLAPMWETFVKLWNGLADIVCPDSHFIVLDSERRALALVGDLNGSAGAPEAADVE